MLNMKENLRQQINYYSFYALIKADKRFSAEGLPTNLSGHSADRSSTEAALAEKVQRIARTKVRLLYDAESPKHFSNK